MVIVKPYSALQWYFFGRVRTDIMVLYVVFQQLGQLYYSDEPAQRSYDTYGMYLGSPMGYDDPYLDEPLHYPVVSERQALKRNTNYVDFYSTTRRPSYRAQTYPASPDSWV